MVEHFPRESVLRSIWLVRFTVAAMLAAVAATTQARDYAPHIMYIFPAGGQRGTTVEGVMARGRGLEGTGEIRISGEGISGQVVAIERPDSRLMQRSKNRQDQAENPNVVRFSVKIAADAEPGARDLWLITPKGATNRMRFVVGQVPEVLEIDEETAEPQTLDTLPVVVNGQYNQGDRDVYRFNAVAGETIVCEVQGRKLKPYIPDAVPGWFQPCLTLYDATGGELQFADDWRFHPDPVLLFEVKQDGEYQLEIRDALYRGREDLVYRLTIGSIPYLTHVFPLGGHRGEAIDVELYGVNLPVAEKRVAIPADAPSLQYIQVTDNGLQSNPLPFAAGDDPEITEAEPNDLPAQANRVDTPVVINGRIERRNDVDHFVFSGRKGQWIVCDVRGRRLDSPIDSIVELLDARGRQLASADDTKDPSAGLITHHADSYLRHRITEDGDYTVRIRDVQTQAGHEFAYRLTLAPPRPDFDMRLFPANLSIAPGTSAVAKVKAYRRDGFREPIDIHVAGLPEQFVVTPTVIPAGQDEARFTITAPTSAPPGVLAPIVTGMAVIPARQLPGTGKPGRPASQLQREAVPAEELMQAFYYWHDIPTEKCLFRVVEGRSFALSVANLTEAVHELPKRGQLPIVIQVSRDSMQVAIEEAQTRLRTATETAEAARQKLEQAQRDLKTGQPPRRAAQQAAAKGQRRPATASASTTPRRVTRPAPDKSTPRVQNPNARITALTRAVQATAAKLNTAKRDLENARAALRAPIMLSGDSLPPGIVVKGTRLAADQNETTIVLSVNDKASIGARYNIIITGTIRVAGDAITSAAPAVPIHVVAAKE